ncbi:MAG: Ribosomal small subunit methyltransferase [Gemmatimonadetes bacterium]|nr:Ribosomal small subunit methyltransferase [Gemmatimonadota bacterium]
MVERPHRTALSTFYAPGPWSDRVEAGDAAAHHAHVKRLSLGDPVRLTSGDGRRALGAIVHLSKRSLGVAVEFVEHIERPADVELLAPVGDRDRMLMLAEKAVELGVSVWRPVIYERSRSVSPRGDGEAFREKLKLRQIAALEQSGGAWLPRACAEVPLGDALGVVTGTTRLLLDQAGERLGAVSGAVCGAVSIGLGPEGGLTDAERSQFVGAGWRLVSLNTNMLRFETAGIAALAIVRSLLR